MPKITIELGNTKKKASGNIIDRIKTFEDACRALGIDPSEKVAIEGPSDLCDDLDSIGAYSKLIIIARALNEGWKPDWANSSQRKWYPYFEYKAGFGFSRTSYAYWHARAAVGSRLCFKSSELAEYAGKQFADIYNEFLNQ